MTRNLLILISIIGLVILAGKIIDNESTDKYEVSPTKESLLYPSLSENIPKIDNIKLTLDGKQHDIIQKNGRWLISNKEDYQIDKNFIDKFLFTISNIKIIEEKTTDARRFNRLGLVDSDDDNFSPIKISLNSTYKFSIGKKRDFGKTENEEVFYIKKANENQVYLASSVNDVHYNTNSIFKNPALNIKDDKIFKVEVSPKNGDKYILSRLTSKNDFEITEPSKKAASSSKLNEISKAIASNLNIIDVKKIPNLGEHIRDISFQTYDRLKINLKLFKIEKDHWIEINFSSEKDSMIDEVTSYNKIVQGWAYKIDQRTANLLMNNLSDIVAKPKNK